MKRFLKDAGLTLGAFIVLVIIIDMWGLHGENTYSYKRHYMDAHADSIELLVMGNSLAEYGINAEVFGPNAWCCGISTRMIVYDKVILEHYLPRMQQLKTVVLPLHYAILAYPRFDDKTGHAKAAVYCYYRYFDIALDTVPYGWLYRSALFSNNFSYRGILNDKCNSYGNALYDELFDGKKEEGHQFEQYDVERAITYLTEMAAMLEAKGVRFIVVTPPVTEAYLEGCTAEMERVLQVIADSVHWHHPMEYRNYMRDPDFRDNQLYMDWDHLNAKGATLFAQRLKTDFGI